jgi:hypothetical protein
LLSAEIRPHITGAARRWQPVADIAAAGVAGVQSRRFLLFLHQITSKNEN